MLLAGAFQCSLLAQDTERETTLRYNPVHEFKDGILTFTFWPRKEKPKQSETFSVQFDAKSSEIVQKYIELWLIAYRYQYEIGISDEQLEEVDSMMKQTDARALEIAQARSKGEISQKKADQDLTKIANELEDVTNRVFLDFQLKRLDELKIHAKLTPLVKGLSAKEMREELKISDEQVAAMKKRKLELENEFMKELEELSAKYRAKALEELSEKQRKQIEDTVGSPVLDKDTKYLDFLKRFLDL